MKLRRNGMETSGCSNQITSLTALGIIRRETPITEGASSRKTIYRLEDSMFLFWYRFVRPNMSGIIQNAGETIYEHMVKPNMSDYMGRVFEDIWPAIFISSPDLRHAAFSAGKYRKMVGNRSCEKAARGN